MRSAVFCLLFLALIALGVQGGHVRLVHVSIPTSTVSISFNGTAKVQNAPFKEVSEYFELTDGVYLVELTINHGDITVLNQTATVNGYSTFVAEGVQKLSLFHYQDPFYRPDVAAGKAIMKFLHAIEGDVVVDLSLNGTKVASNVGYTQMTNYFTVSEPATNATAETNLLSFSTIIPVTRGLAYTTIVFGTAVDPDWMAVYDHDFRAPTVRVVQASPDAASLSVSVGGVAFPSLSFTSQSSYQEVPKGVQLVNVTGGEKGLTFNTPDLVPLKAYTVVIYGFVNPPAGNLNGLTGEVLLDAPSDPNTATVRFGNLVPDSPTFLVEFNGKNFTTFYGYMNSTFSIDTNDTQVYSIKVYNSTNKLGKRYWRRSLADYTTLLTTSITVNKGTLYTVLIEGSGTNIRVVADNQPAPNPDNGSSGLSSGAIAGIVIGSVFGAILLVGLIVYCYRRSKYQSIP